MHGKHGIRQVPRHRSLALAACTPTHLPTRARAYMHACMHSCTHAYAYTHVHIQVHVGITNASLHPSVRTCVGTPASPRHAGPAAVHVCGRRGLLRVRPPQVGPYAHMHMQCTRSAHARAYSSTCGHTSRSTHGVVHIEHIEPRPPGRGWPWGTRLPTWSCQVTSTLKYQPH